MARGRKIAVAIVALALSACGSDEAAAPGDVSVSEAKALDEAAEMIEARRPPPPVVQPSAPLPPLAPAAAASPAETPR